KRRFFPFSQRDAVLRNLSLWGAVGAAICTPLFGACIYALDRSADPGLIKDALALGFVPIFAIAPLYFLATAAADHPISCRYLFAALSAALPLLETSSGYSGFPHVPGWHYLSVLIPVAVFSAAGLALAFRQILELRAERRDTNAESLGIRNQ
ncbi:MAG: hypothetical protein AAFZ58_11630, partial [Pseudomonadota bacterium]